VDFLSDELPGFVKHGLSKTSFYFFQKFRQAVRNIIVKMWLDLEH